jgi:Tol biopolymer transport system component
LVNADGSGLCNLTRDPEADNDARWSPDGTRLVFESARVDTDGNADSQNWNTYAASIDDLVNGRLPTRLSTAADNSGGDWSPGGRWIIFTSHVDDQWGMYAVDAAGGSPFYVHPRDVGQTAWTPPGVGSPFCTVDFTAAFQAWGDWSLCLLPSFPEGQAWRWAPDGSRIAYVTDSGLWVASQDGSERLNLVQDSDGIYWPEWSPDSRQISFVDDGEQSGYYSIYVINSDGTGLRRLADPALQAQEHQWSPDGRYLLYTPQESGLTQTPYVANAIHLLDRISGQDSQLTPQMPMARIPQWRPRPGLTPPLPSPTLEAPIASSQAPSPEPTLTETPSPSLTPPETQTPVPTSTPSETPALEPVATETPGPTSTAILAGLDTPTVTPTGSMPATSTSSPD